jgi:CheY-like chemotaxis protein
MPTPLRIWLVDDDADEQMLVRQVMGRLPSPVELQVLDDPTHVMCVLEEATADNLPHLILCDVKMRNMSGFEFVEWLRKSRWKALPVVMCSNSQRDDDITRIRPGRERIPCEITHARRHDELFRCAHELLGTAITLPRLS